MIKNTEIEIFEKENPEIKESEFNLSLIQDKVNRWKTANYELDPAQKNRVEILRNISELPQVIIIRYTKSGGFDVIDGWHRTCAAILNGKTKISAMVKDCVK